MKKMVLLLCAALSLLSFAEEEVLKAILVPNMTIFYECNLKALGTMPNMEDKLEKMDNVPMSDALRMNSATEKMMKALGLDPKKDISKMDMVAALNDQQLASLQRGAKMDKWPFCGAVETLKPIDVATAPEAITTYLSEIGEGGSCTPFKVGELNGLKLKMPVSKKMKISELTLLFPPDGKGMFFGTEAEVKAAAERLVSKNLNAMPAEFIDLKKIAKPNAHYLVLFKVPAELQSNLKGKAIAQAQGNPMEAAILGEMANVSGAAISCTMSEKGFEVVVATQLPTPENAMAFKNTLLDGMVKPILSMLVTQYAAQQLDFIEGLKTSLEGSVAKIETVVTFEDLNSIAGHAMQQMQQN